MGLVGSHMATGGGGSSSNSALSDGVTKWFRGFTRISEPVQLEPLQLGEITAEELQAYDGTDPSKPLLVAIKAQIYDVSQSRDLYGRGGPFALYAGKDASRAMTKMSFEENDLTGDIAGLSLYEAKALTNHENKFKSKYVKVGTLKTRNEEQDLKESLVKTRRAIVEILVRMEGLLEKVRIWRNQCENLLQEYQAGVEVIAKVLDALIVVKEEAVIVMNPSLVKFMCSRFICSMLEGEALLLFCGENDYNRAAFALSSPPPFPQSFSKFALVLRDLGWIMDFICYVKQQYIVGNSSFGDWRWCVRRCRLIFQGNLIAGLGVLEDEILEADGHRSTHDRNDLLETLNLTPINTPVVQIEDNENQLKAIWRKRLLTRFSYTAGHDLDVPNCFWIDIPEVEFGKPLANGSLKSVYRSEWLGERVAISYVTNISRKQLEAEASILARVQHPNIVQLMGCAYKEDDQNQEGFFVTELMEQDLENLIRQQLRGQRSGSTLTGLPFALPVAVDIALQIVEAIIYLKQCGVIHRDIKPKNCLASTKYQKRRLPANIDVPMYYTIKLIDFDTAKLRGSDSYFHTYKRGTPYYMAPEVYGRSDEECSYTWSADVYSFEMTCYHVFTGQPPFENKRFEEVQTFIRGGGRPSFPLECPRILKDLIERCWAQVPRQRPTFQQIREDLWHCQFYYA